jgi:hypothetical protein
VWSWSGRWLAGLAALGLLTHCGGGAEVQQQELEEPRPQALATVEQELLATRTFSATADARVEAASPTGNFGGASLLGADQSPQVESYLRFSISGVTGRVSSARLRLYATDGSSDGPRVYRTAGGWTESGITWSTRPAPTGSPLDDEGAISSGTWVEYDVTGAVSGDGELNLALLPSSGNGTDFSSREASRVDLRPQLVITFEPVNCMPRRERYFSTWYPDHDGYVSQGSPSSNYGQAAALLVDGSPRLESYLQFDVSFSSSAYTVVDARLQLYAFDSTTDGPLLYRVGNAWSEQSLTWNTRPGPLGGPLGNLGTVSSGSWATYNVTGVVTGTGTYSFGLIPESGNGVDFYSAESTDYRLFPQLTLTQETPPYCSYRGAGGGLTGWARQLGGEGYERLGAMATDAGGGFVAAGVFGDAVFPDGEGLALARYSADGTLLWSRVVATDDVYVADVAVTPLGNILVMGNYEGSPDLGTGPLPPVPDEFDSPPGFFIARFSPSGATQWVRSFVPTGEAFGHLRTVIPGELTTDAEGSVIFTGTFFGTLNLGGGPMAQTSDEHIPGFIAKFSWDGGHLWSRSFETELPYEATTANTVATDAGGNILVGGLASAGTNLGAGPVGATGPFIAKYTPTGSLLWARVFSGTLLGSQVASVRAGPTGTVAFTANLGGTFTFAGGTYTAGDPSDPLYQEGGFLGTLSAAGSDGWIRSLGRIRMGELVVDSGGALTATGTASHSLDLGGGSLGLEPMSDWAPFAMRYSGSGSHLWSRTFDPDLALYQLALQPDGAVLLGGTSHEQVELDTRTFTPRGDSDLFYLQLRP